MFRDSDSVGRLDCVIDVIKLKQANVCNHAVKYKGVSFRKSKITIFLLALPRQGYSNFNAMFLHPRDWVKKIQCSEQGTY